MEEKKSIKISLSTFFLILALIAICIMGYFIYSLYGRKQEADKNVQELTNKVTNLENTINDIHSKTEDIISTNSTSNNATTNNKSKKFTDEEIKNAIDNYLYIQGKLYGSPDSMLKEIGFGSYVSENETPDKDNYKKTNLKYQEFKNKVLTYMTDDWFENNFKKFYFKEVNGYLYYFDGGATGVAYRVDGVSLKGDYSDSSYIANISLLQLGDVETKQNIEFHITNYNGNCVISYCD